MELEQLKENFINSYIDFTISEIELINSAKTVTEFDKIAHALVAKYNEHPVK